MSAQPGPAESAPEREYWAFISYSSKDVKAAAKLHRALESYRVPKRTRAAGARRGQPVPEAITPIFRDRDEMALPSDLAAALRGYLARSRSLIVLCSHASARSWQVDEEIRVFRELHPERPILAVLLDGDVRVRAIGCSSAQIGRDGLLAFVRELGRE